LQRGWADFSKWSRAMVYEFGEPIRPHLDQLWGAAQDEWQRRQTDTPPLPSGNSPLPTSAKPSLHQCLALIACLALAGAWIWGDAKAPTGASAPPKTLTFEEASETVALDDPTDLQ